MPETCTPPSALPWQPAWVVIRGDDGRYSSSLAPSSLVIATSADLYVKPSGNDNLGGGSWANALENLWRAIISMAGPTTIYVETGTYDMNHGFGGFGGLVPSYSFNIVPVNRGGGARLRSTCSDLALSWSAIGGGAYSASLAFAPYAVVDETDRTDEGDGERLTLAASVVACQAQPGSYYWATNIITVHTRDGRAPDEYLHAFKGTAGQMNLAINNAGVSFYAENTDFMGGNRAVFMNDGSIACLNLCGTRYAEDAGYQVNSAAEAYAFGCVSNENGADGLAYTTTLHVLEVDCTSVKNGYGVSDISNASTGHDGATIIRLNGRYENSKGPNVADVGAGYTWMLGSAIGTTRASVEVQQVGFYTDGNAYLRDVRLDSHTLDLKEDGVGSIYVNDTTYDTSSGSIKEYRLDRYPFDVTDEGPDVTLSQGGGIYPFSVR